MDDIRLPSIKRFSFLKDVLAAIKPVEGIWAKVDLFVDAVQQQLIKNHLRAVVQVGGSVAKDTYLKGDFDCDLFIKFDYSYEDDDISTLLESAIAGFNPVRLHGSRDYFQIQRDDVKFEIVPVLEIDDPKKARNVTDASPLH